MDTEYLKETVGKSLSEGLAHLAKTRAHDAVEFLGYYMINFVEKCQNEIKVGDFKDEYNHKKSEADYEQQQLDLVQNVIDEKQKENVEILEGVREELRTAEEITPELMKKVIETIQVYTNAANIYIGHVIPAAPGQEENEEGEGGDGGEEPAEEEEEEEAKEEKEPNEEGGEEEDDPTKHFPPSEEIDPVNPDPDPIPVNDSKAKIEYLYVTAQNDFMVDNLLFEGEGVTWEVWKKKKGEGEEEEEEEPEDDEDEDGKEKKPKKEEPPPELYIPEVLLNEKIRYFDIPKLGSYLAIPFTWNSSIHPHAFDDLFKPKKAEGEEEEEGGEEEKEEEEEEEDDDGNKKPKKPKKDEPPPPPEAKPLPVQMLICLDTMGYDKQFTDDARLEVHTWSPLLSDIYERIERKQFLEEVDKFKALQEQNIKDKEEVAGINKVSEKAIKAGMKDLRHQKKIPAEEKAEMEMRMRYEIAIGNLMDNFKDRINLYGDLRIQPDKTITTILVNCLYLLGYFNGDLMEDRRPHVLDWQKVRKLLNDDLINKIQTYDCVVKHEVAPYSTVKAIKKNIRKISEEKLSEEAPFMYYLLQWMKACIEFRIAATNKRKKEELDIRLEQYEKEKEEERIRKEQEEEERQKREEEEEERRQREEEEEEERKRQEEDKEDEGDDED